MSGFLDLAYPKVQTSAGPSVNRGGGSQPGLSPQRKSLKSLSSGAIKYKGYTYNVDRLEVLVDADQNAVKFIISYWPRYLHTEFTKKYREKILNLNGLQASSIVRKGRVLKVIIPVNISFLLPEVVITASKHDYYKDTEGLYLGWVHKSITAYATPDQDMPMFEVPYNSKLEILAIARSAKNKWALATGYGNDPLAGQYFCVDLSRGIFLADKKGKNLPKTAGTFLVDPNVIKASQERWTMMKADPDCYLQFIPRETTIDGIIQRYYGSLINADNIFMFRDTDSYRLRCLANSIYQNNVSAFRKADYRTLQAGSFLKLHSVDYLSNNTEVFLNQEFVLPYDESTLQDIIVTLEALETNLQFTLPQSTSLPGFVGGLFNGIYQNLKEMVTEVWDSISTVYKVIKYFIEHSFEEMAKSIEDILALSMEDLSKALSSVFEALKDHYVGLWDDFVTALKHPALFEKTWAAGTAIGWVVLEVLKTIFSGSATLWLKAVSKSVPILGKVVTKIFKFVDKLKPSIKSDIPEYKGSKIYDKIDDGNTAAAEKAFKDAHLDDLPITKKKSKNKNLKDNDITAERLETDKLLNDLKQKKVKHLTSAVHTPRGLRLTFTKDRTQFYVELDHNKRVTHAHINIREPHGNKGYNPLDSQANKKFNEKHRVTFDDGSQSDAGHILAQEFLDGLPNEIRVPQNLFQNRYGGNGQYKGTWRWLEQKIKKKLSSANNLKGKKNLAHSVQFQVKVDWRTVNGSEVSSLRMNLKFLDQDMNPFKVSDIDIGLGKTDRISTGKIAEIESVLAL